MENGNDGSALVLFLSCKSNLYSKYKSENAFEEKDGKILQRQKIVLLIHQLQIHFCKAFDKIHETTMSHCTNANTVSIVDTILQCPT